jgi:hypothetical protein
MPGPVSRTAELARPSGSSRQPRRRCRRPACSAPHCSPGWTSRSAVRAAPATPIALGRAATAGAPAACPAADSAAASCSHCASSARTRVHSHERGGGLPSRRDSVSRSLTSVCMRCACCAISAGSARAPRRVERQVLQRLDEAGQHRQRRADLVRHVGHEVAPHRLGLLQRRDVARQQHAAIRRRDAVAPRAARHGAWRAAGCRRSPRRGVVALKPVGAKPGSRTRFADAAAGHARRRCRGARPPSGCTTRCGPARPAAPRRWAKPGSRRGIPAAALRRGAPAARAAQHACECARPASPQRPGTARGQAGIRPGAASADRRPRHARRRTRHSKAPTRPTCRRRRPPATSRAAPPCRQSHQEAGDAPGMERDYPPRPLSGALTPACAVRR